MIPAELQSLHVEFFKLAAPSYNMSTQEGCGQYTEAWVRYAQGHGYPKVGHLKKHEPQTLYNGHAIDAFLYADGTGNPNGLYSAVDIIADAETNHASAGWGVDTPCYTSADWMATPGPVPTPIKMVPYVAYDENANQEMKRELAYDYARRPQNADFDVCIWNARVFHNAYMGPDGTPLGMVNGTSRARNEWCAALGIPVVPVPANWKIGDPA